MSDTKTELLAATQTVLQEHGYHGLTTARVAEQAGFSQSLVHHYYETKRDLVVAFLSYYREQVAMALDRLRPRPPRERLVAVLSLFAGNAVDDEARSFYLAMCELQAYAGRYDAYQDALAAYNQLLFEFVVETIEDGIEDGTFRECTPESTARLLLTAVDGALFQETSVGVDAVEPVITDGIVEYVLADLYVDEPPEPSLDGIAATVDGASAAGAESLTDRGS